MNGSLCVTAQHAETRYTGWWFRRRASTTWVVDEGYYRDGTGVSRSYSGQLMLTFRVTFA